MADNGGGAIVNVSAMVAARGMAGMAAYGAAKAALELLTRSWTAMADAIPAMVAAIPLRRAASSAEVADIIVYLASDATGYITGAVLPVDGGRTAAL